MIGDVTPEEMKAAFLRWNRVRDYAPRLLELLRWLDVNRYVWDDNGASDKVRDLLSEIDAPT